MRADDIRSMMGRHSGTALDLPRRVCRPGIGDIHVVRRGSRSIVGRAFARSPLRLLTPRNHGHGAWIFTSTYGGGLVGGDTISLDVRVGAGATMLLQTQASTKVYRSAQPTSSSLDAAVGEGGLLAILPDPVVCFAGSTYTQRQTVALEGSASLILMDWMTSGRRAFGERWVFDAYANRLMVRSGTRLLLLDATTLDARDGSLAARMGRFECVCMMALIGPAVLSHATAALTDVASLAPPRHADLLLAGAPLGDDGCVLRMGGVSVEDVGRAARKYLHFLPALLGDDPWARKW